MHDTDAQGNEFFKCDTCLSSWSEQRPMVEGHRGSLVCAACLTAAYEKVVNLSAGVVLPPGTTCVMCLEPRKDPCWAATSQPAVFVCLRCIKQSARVLEKDAESGWKRPGGQDHPSLLARTPEEDAPDDDDGED